MSEDAPKIAGNAVLVEGLVTYLNQFFVAGAFPWQIILSLILEIVIAVEHEKHSYHILNSS